MNLEYTKGFLKSFKKRVHKNSNLDKKFQERLQLFLQNPSNKVLKEHKLSGAKKHLRAFSVTGDVRVIYRKEENTIYLIDIGTHNQVY